MLRRAMLATLAITGLWLAPTALASNPIQDENARPGTVGWELPDAPDGAVEAYSSQISARPGDTLQFHVNTSPAARYRIRILRLGWYDGVGARLVACIPGCASDTQGADHPVGAMDPVTGELSAGWPVTDTTTVGDDWTTGYYIGQVQLTAGASAGSSSQVVPFIVREPAGADAPMLVQASVNTWLAYNEWGGKSLYASASTNGIAAKKVSFDRPLTSAEFFTHEYPFVRFLEREGFDVAYQSDVDTDAEPSSVLGRELLISNGHDEYWTKGMRDAFEAAREAGGNLAFMGSNTAYWQVRYEKGRRTMVGYKTSADPEPDKALKTIRFRDLAPKRPECRLIGVQYDYGQYDTGSVRRDFAVTEDGAAHPWLAGSGFSAGDTIDWSVGYEWDSVTPGCAVPTPTVLLHYEGINQGGEPTTAEATVYEAPSGTRVFGAGTLRLGWKLDPWVPAGESATGHTADPRVQSMIRAMLHDLGPSAAPEVHAPPPPPASDPVVPDPPPAPAPNVDAIPVSPGVIGERPPVAAIGSIRLRGTRAVGVRVRCPAGAEACRGSLRLRMLAGRQAGVRSFAVAPGARLEVTVPLSAPARRRLGARRMLSLDVVLVPSPQGLAGAVSRRGVLRLPRTPVSVL